MLFKHTSGPYNAGEIAGFSEEEAKKLEERGIAVPYQTEADTEPEQPAATYQTEDVASPPADKMLRPGRKGGRR